jgi:REP element-mobilizing transposase RayT
VPDGAKFHVRISIVHGSALLTQPAVAKRLLESVDFYHAGKRWYAWLFLLMPDHVHAILSFPAGSSFRATVGDWKRYQRQRLDARWQDGFFDHRLRNDEEFVEKVHYIRMNPVRKGLCSRPEEWSWVTEPWKTDDLV